MNKDLISVVIPVYNAEKYLEQCLDSILRQTYECLEIIVVNDGSTDNSLEICKKYERKDKRIRVVNQRNHGNTRARKAGLAYATGSYICFVDSDDWIKENTIWNLYEMITDSKADVAAVNYHIWRENQILEMPLRLEEGIYETDEDWERLYTKSCEINNNFAVWHNIWGKLYKTDLYRRAQSYVRDSINIGEDLVCMYAWMTLADKVVISHEPLYFYRTVSDSMIQKKNDKLLMDINKVYNEICEIHEDLESDEGLFKAAMQYLNRWTIAAAGRLFCETSASGYVFPYESIPGGAKVVLYGAGRVGQSYYQQIRAGAYCELTGVVDRNARKYKTSAMPVAGVVELDKLTFDYILIAIKSPKAAQEIKLWLKEQGIDENKIIWKEPEIMENHIMLNCM